MTRKVILDAEWMLKARANGWDVNYERRDFACTQSEQFCRRVLRSLDYYGFPDPVMELTGWLDKEASGLLMSNKVRDACDATGLRLADYEYLARWYWDADEWQKYVRAFTDLPEPHGFYMFSWDGRFVPNVVQVEYESIHNSAKFVHVEGRTVHNSAKFVHVEGRTVHIE